MQAVTLRRWGWVHKWSSLVSTLFILLLCLTGLPLIFSHEIEHLTGSEIEAQLRAEDAERAGAGAVGLAGAVFKHMLHQVEVRAHGRISSWLAAG